MNKKIKQTKANVFYLIIGRLFVYSVLYLGSVAFWIWAFNQITTCK